MSTLTNTAQPARTRDLSFVAMMAALTAVCAWITVPFSIVPFTLQTFAVFLALALLGGKRGTAAIALYLCLGLVGLPVFAGFSGGSGLCWGLRGATWRASCSPVWSTGPSPQSWETRCR